jgi:hypothetical protein
MRLPVRRYPTARSVGIRVTGFGPGGPTTGMVSVFLTLEEAAQRGQGVGREPSVRSQQRTEPFPQFRGPAVRLLLGDRDAGVGESSDALDQLRVI